MDTLRHILNAKHWQRQPMHAPQLSGQTRVEHKHCSSYVTLNSVVMVESNHADRQLVAIKRRSNCILSGDSINEKIRTSRIRGNSSQSLLSNVIVWSRTLSGLHSPVTASGADSLPSSAHRPEASRLASPLCVCILCGLAVLAYPVNPPASDILRVLEQCLPRRSAAVFAGLQVPDWSREPVPRAAEGAVPPATHGGCSLVG